jgi:hypothetical protein
MNERIRELYVKAYGYFPAPIGEPELEKFAELIIKECTKILADNSEFRSCVIIGKHFGVFGVEE